MDTDTPDKSHIVLGKVQLGDLVSDLWRIQKRSLRDGCESVQLACERAFDRLQDMGFSVDEMVGTAYHSNMRARVVHEEGGANNRRITECLSPAVYFQEQNSQQPELIKPAEVVIKGEG